MLQISVRKLRDNAQLPYRATEQSAGYDLFAALEEDITLFPGERTLIPTGLSIAIPDPHYGGFIFARSGLSSKKGIALSNGVGVIDADYRGEICVAITNFSDCAYTIHTGDRIAQILFLPIETANFVLTDVLDETERGNGGFGSTSR